MVSPEKYVPVPVYSPKSSLGPAVGRALYLPLSAVAHCVVYDGYKVVQCPVGAVGKCFVVLVSLQAAQPCVAKHGVELFQDVLWVLVQAEWVV